MIQEYKYIRINSKKCNSIQVNMKNNLPPSCYNLGHLTINWEFVGHISER